MKRCKDSVAKLVSGYINTSSREKDTSEQAGEKSLCNIPGWDFISRRVNEGESRDHFRIDHKDSELTENSFIRINSAMAEAMEIKKENNSLTNEG